jgi:hypothetical protein
MKPILPLLMFCLLSKRTSQCFIQRRRRSKEERKKIVNWQHKQEEWLYFKRGKESMVALNLNSSSSNFFYQIQQTGQFLASYTTCFATNWKKNLFSFSSLLGCS